MERIRVIVADDEALVRHALKVFIDATPDLELVGMATNGSEGVALCVEHKPDVALVDIQMPVLSGIDAAAQITKEAPETRVLALTTFSSERHVIAALRAGASGYLVKDTPPDEIVAAVRDVHEGRSVLSPRITQELIVAVRDASDVGGRVVLGDAEALTDRELATVALLAEGKSNAEIAQAMFISEATVKSNLGRIMTKWGVRDRVQVLIRAVRLGLVSI